MPTARPLPLALLVALCTVLLGSGVAIAAWLTVSTANLTTFTRTYGSPATCSLEPSADSYVEKDTPLTNYGTQLTVDVNSDATATRRGLLRFDLASCSPAISAGAIVGSATLRVTLAADAADARTYDLYRVTTAWDEASVHWDSQPGVSASPASSLSVSAGTPASAVLDWNVLANVQDFVSGAATNDGWRVNDSAEGTASTGLQFHAREAASGRPQLVITYVD